MPLGDLLTIADIKAIFAEEIATLGGTVSDTFEDEIRLIARSILPPLQEVRKADQVQGGVALRANEESVWVHPYVFRLVCKNGAIIAHAFQTRQLEAHEFVTPEEAVSAIRNTIQDCGSSEAFSAAAEEIRSAGRTEADAALSLLPLLSRFPSGVGSGVVVAIMERFLQDRDQSRFALMNAVTSVARDTPDPELRWRLEELGGSIASSRRPTFLDDDQAVAVAGESSTRSEEWLGGGVRRASSRSVG
ncbi:MAG TPA: hypothetical protein VH592_15945 [Gemmataceae bacterium]|jgi:hypothetical protein